MDLNKNKALIEKQKELVFKNQPEINLIRPCRLDDGIIRHSEFEKNRFKVKFVNESQKVCFFIPASGSGSRMFKFLFEFLDEPDEKSRSQTERFLNAIESFAFFELLPIDIKRKVREYDINLDNIISYLLNEEGLALGAIPKGLIPFHRSRSFILNAFQEQLLQGLRIKEDCIHFHFTINKAHEEKIKSSLNSIQQLTGRECTIDWSEQDSATNSIAFHKDKETVLDEHGNVLTRPSGHGALLENLNQIDADIIFIKNIDNIQHESQAEPSIENLKYLGGILNVFKTELKEALDSENPKNQLHALDQTYLSASLDTDFQTLSLSEIKAFVNRPIRVCGMERNEGQPGGGPFWEEKNGIVSKQIVEKSQISKNSEQYRLMVKGQYFNPVLMAISTKNTEGEKLNLHDYADKENYFIVEKSYKGEAIFFMEKPGLWNGGMGKWLSIFVEVPSEVFTPVKTVLDLLDSSHLESVE